MQPKTIIKASNPLKIIIPPKSVRDASNRSSSGDAGLAEGAAKSSGESVGAQGSAADADKGDDEIIVDGDEDEDMLGDVYQWRERYVHPNHPVDSMIWRHF